MSTTQQTEATPREVWLRPNRRALGSFALAAAFMLAGSIFVLLTSPGRTVFVSLSLAIILLVCLLVIFLSSLWRPRLAYHCGQLLVYLRPGRPISIPIDIVECFFLGQADSLLGRSPFGSSAATQQTSTIVVRLAESAREWKHVEVQPALGQWCDGYIVIRGTWCEPLSGELVGQLNHRLVAAHRAKKVSGTFS